MSQPPSRETRIFLALWRKAYQLRDDPTPVHLNILNESSARSIRRGLYRAIKPYREGELFDEELRKSAELFVIKVEAHWEAFHVVFAPRASLEIMSSDLQRLGITENDLLLQTETLNDPAKESLKKLLGEKKRSTPFFDRED